MARRWIARIGLAAFLTLGLLAWGSLVMRGANQCVFNTTRGRWTADIHGLALHDLAIVPGVMFRKGRPDADLFERLHLALELYRTGRVPAILVSGDEQRAGHEVTGMRQWLVAHGVPEARVTSDQFGTRTLVTMDRAARLFGARNAIICTQALHAPRTAFLAQTAGIDAIVVVPTTSPKQAKLFERETLKITLAFLERYLLRHVGT